MDFPIPGETIVFLVGARFYLAPKVKGHFYSSFWMNSKTSTPSHYNELKMNT